MHRVAERRLSASARRPAGLAAAASWSLLLLLAYAPPPAAASPAAELLDAAAGAAPWITSVRRELHAIPELMFEEHKTGAALRKHLDALRIPHKPFAKTGLVARIGKGQPTVVLRADMDALPVSEPDGLEFKSKHEGRMVRSWSLAAAARMGAAGARMAPVCARMAPACAPAADTRLPHPTCSTPAATTATCRCCWARPSC